MSDVNPVNPVDIFFSKLGARLGVPLQVSPISIPISFQTDISAPIEAYEAHIALLGLSLALLCFFSIDSF